jgi:hypothetical protein
MQGMLSGGLLVVAFVAVAGLGLLVVLRLYRISRPGRPVGAQAAGRRSPGQGDQADG